jgi:predicted SprT family Zn-dependent metalloprotease
MKSLIELANRCMEELDAIDIQYAEVIHWEVNTRAKKRWGLCKHNPDGSYTISISSRLLTNNVADDGAINTIIHELLHTVEGCMNHKEPWKREADKVNRAYGYNIKRGSSAEEKGVEPIESTPKEIKYQFKCKDCGKVYSRTRASNFTKDWKNYRCGVCGGEFIKVI